jgi:hypothetical protein
MITATVDNRDVMRKLNKLEQMTGKPLEKLVTQSVRRVCVNLSKATLRHLVLASRAKKSGEGAIKWDYGVSTLARERGFSKGADTFGTKQITERPKEKH